LRLGQCFQLLATTGNDVTGLLRLPSVEAAQVWVDDFVSSYNEDHKQSGIRAVTPAQCHDGHEGAILGNRAQVYAAARSHTPDRRARARPATGRRSLWSD
jgi:hypothetical protein